MIDPHPTLPEFEYIKPESIEKALSFLKDTAGQSRPFLGGTDCFIAVRDKKMQPKFLVDLKHLEGFNTLAYDGIQGLTIGAAVNLNRLIASEEVQTHYPVLVQAAKEVGSYQLRTRATLVGNLCNASPCGDTIAPCLAYQGSANIIGPVGQKNVPLIDFFKGPGKTILEPGEIVQSVNLPPAPAGAKGVYQSIGRNTLGDLAIAAVTVLAFPESQTSSGYRFLIALSAVAPTVIFVEEAQLLLAEKPIDAAGLEEAAQVAAQTCKPIDDIRASAQYRRAMIQTLTLRALQTVWQELQK